MMITNGINIWGLLGWLVIILTSLICIRFLLRILFKIQFNDEKDLIRSYNVFGFGSLLFSIYALDNMTNIFDFNYSIFIYIFMLHFAIFGVVTWVMIVSIIMINTLNNEIGMPFRLIKNFLDALEEGNYFRRKIERGIIFINTNLNPFYNIKINPRKKVEISMIIAYLLSGIIVSTVIYNLIASLEIPSNQMETVKHDFEVYIDIFVISLIPYGLEIITLKKTEGSIKY